MTGLRGARLGHVLSPASGSASPLAFPCIWGKGRKGGVTLPAPCALLRAILGGVRGNCSLGSWYVRNVIKLGTRGWLADTRHLGRPRLAAPLSPRVPPKAIWPLASRAWGQLQPCAQSRPLCWVDPPTSPCTGDAGTPPAIGNGRGTPARDSEVPRPQTQPRSLPHRVGVVQTGRSAARPTAPLRAPHATESLCAPADGGPGSVFKCPVPARCDARRC